MMKNLIKLFRPQSTILNIYLYLYCQMEEKKSEREPDVSSCSKPNSLGVVAQLNVFMEKIKIVQY